MIFYFILGLSFLLIASIIRLKRFFFFELAKGSLALVNELISEEDEDEKIEEIQKSTNKLLLSFLKIFILLAIATVIGSVPIIIYSLVAHSSYDSLDFASFYSILAISIGATIPFLIPTKNTSAYSDLSKLLHHMALDNYNIAEKLFRREKKGIKKRELQRQEEFIIVTGLARAGTTSLMLDLSKIEDLTSLSYANMPFLTCPNLWAKIYNPRKKELKERSHKDGIMIGLDSNEALEEYFFKMCSNDSFIGNTSLKEYEVPEKDYEAYLDYHAIVKNTNEKVYLAKNNNFILRYNSIRNYNDKFVLVVLFREPLMHAASLMEKHAYYSKLQQEDPFVLNYMNWLGHHEFGLNQKPFEFNAGESFKNSDKNSIDFWLESWINYYSYALSMRHTNTVFINYSTYCEHPKKVIEGIINKTNIKTEIPNYKGFDNKRKVEMEASSELLNKASNLYKDLCALGNNL